MRRINLSFLICALLPLMALAQNKSALEVNEFELSNGMRVWLNVDHSQPKVFGAVVVNAGSVDCPNTGIAHYFEHIMFKGTDQLGTTDYAAEKVYLDSISMKYDELAQTVDVEKRKAIQSEINRLNIKAADYAIPNEFNRLTSKYGGSELNAGTSYDMTYYHNTFSPQFIEQWCELNSHRFIHPVFRLFQSELETVYEEKNMYADNPAAMMLEQISGKFLAGTPYAYSIIGSTENLKNPRLSEMEEFYKNYYVASNMGLILSGDINPETLMPLLERTFGKLERGVPPVHNKVTAPAITGNPEEKFLFPLPLFKMSILAFRSPGLFDPDEPALKVAMMLLSNENNTGLIDELTNNNRVMMAESTSLGFNQTGATIVVVVPKLLGKSSTAERLCLEQIQKLKNGEFTDEQLLAIKQIIHRDYESSLETISKRSELMVQAMSAGVKWSDYLASIENVNGITRDDVMRVANKYMGNDYMIFHKKYGTCDVEQISKPEYTPVVPKNANEKSAFAKYLEQMPVTNNAPRLVDIGTDAVKTPLNNGNMLYSNANPVNDIFTLNLNFNKGTWQDKMLEAAANYVNMLGTDSLDIKGFGAAMQHLGATMTISSDQSKTTVSVNGYDANFEPTVKLISHFLGHMKNDENKLDDLKDAASSEEDSFWDENQNVFIALLSKVGVGDEQSPFLNRRLTSKELKKVKGDALIDVFKQIYACRCNVDYCGNLDAGQVASIINTNLAQVGGTVENAFVDRNYLMPTQPTVYVFDMPKARQTLIGFFHPLPGVTGDRDKALLDLWGEYFGGGMSSVMFQEVREFRSMAYAAQGLSFKPKRAHSSLQCGHVAFVGTQADKTMSCIALLDSLMANMPIKPENFDVARQSLLNDINNTYPSFRGKAPYILECERLGYNEDMSATEAQLLPTLTQDDVVAFYRQHIQGKPYQLMIVGDLKKLDLKALEKYGTVVKLKKEDIYRKK